MVACLALYGIGALIQPVDESLFTLLVRVVAFTLVVFLIEAVRRRVLALERSTEDLEVIRKGTHAGDTDLRLGGSLLGLEGLTAALTPLAGLCLLVLRST